MSLAVVSNWLWNFGIGYTTPYLVDKTTHGPTGIKAAGLGVKVFFIWGSTCAGCLIFAYFCIPETMGLSLEQIDLLYRKSSIIGSNKYRAQMLATNETFMPSAKVISLASLLPLSPASLKKKRWSMKRTMSCNY